MSSASKLRMAIMKSRQTKQRDDDQVNEQKGNYENEEEEWERVIQQKVNTLVVSRIRGSPSLKESTQRMRIDNNVRFWVQSARTKGCDDSYHASGGCPGPFRPAPFFDNTAFAHYSHFAPRVTGRHDYLPMKCRSTCELRFQEFFKTGRVKWRVCHKVETMEENGNTSSKIGCTLLRVV